MGGRDRKKEGQIKNEKRIDKGQQKRLGKRCPQRDKRVEGIF